MKKDCILVLDFGSQYTQLIARRLREQGVYAEILPFNASLDEIRSKAPKGIVLSGGPASVYEKDAYFCDEGVFTLGVPVLGVCYGMQLMAQHFGGIVERSQAQEFGKARFHILGHNIEKATEYDLSDILALQKSAFKDEAQRVGDLNIAPLTQDLESLKQEFKQMLILKCVSEGKIVGSVRGEFKNDTTFIGRLFVEHSHRGKGIGKTLMCAIEKALPAKRYEIFTSSKSKENLIMYAKLGYKEFEKDLLNQDTQVIFLEKKEQSCTEKQLHIHEVFKRDLTKIDIKHIAYTKIPLHFYYMKSKKPPTLIGLSLFDNIKQDSMVWMSHGDKVTRLPKGFDVIATSENSEICGMVNLETNMYGVQFHPEVQHSEFGAKMLKNFAKYICECESTWNMGSFAKAQSAAIKAQVGADKVLCAVSGGVDSSVVAALLANAIKEQVVVVFVDNGLLRKNEKEAVETMFRHNLGINLITIDASKTFLERLKGVVEPEKKRKIIGNTFIEVFEAEAKKHKGIKYLAQGTLYTDIIESSVVGASKTIKSHHNVGGLPEKMNLKLIEPLKEIFKDEVRALGLELGLSKELVFRHPFPGPGLAIRIMGEVNELNLELLRNADVILREELKSSGWYDKTWQAFCVLLNVKSVGVMGDNRTYDNAVCVRVVNASDGMTASFSHLPYELLENISRRIINEVAGINRVVYDISSKPPATIEWE